MLNKPFNDNAQAMQLKKTLWFFTLFTVAHPTLIAITTVNTKSFNTLFVTFIFDPLLIF